MEEEAIDMYKHTAVASRLYRQQSRILEPKISQPQESHSEAKK
jgi:hypothetical protein